MPDTLKTRITRHIEMSGPLPLAEYMHWCMADREQGYYAREAIIGEGGDFITAPETSQMFGELIGIWAINAWQSLGSPSPFNLVELGPGRGTLMSDLLRAAKTVPAFLEAAQIHLVETSETMRNAQQQALSTYHNIHWHNTIKELGDNQDCPLIVIANEFLDVLPIRQYVKQDGNWHERSVATNAHGDLAWVLNDGKLEPALLPAGHEDEPDGAVYEISTPREAYTRNLAELVAKQSGAALLIDYGHTQSGFGDTLQALRDHKPVDPLAEPGMADLTSHVDFAALMAGIKDLPLTQFSPLNQGDFLIALGLLERAGQLGADKSPQEQAKITRQTERLAHPSQMGDLFQVFAFSTCSELVPFS